MHRSPCMFVTLVRNRFSYAFRAGCPISRVVSEKWGGADNPTNHLLALCRILSFTRSIAAHHPYKKRKARGPLKPGFSLSGDVHTSQT